MAGRFEAPKGGEGFVPEYTDARPGKKGKGKNTPEAKAEKANRPAEPKAAVQAEGAQEQRGQEKGKFETNSQTAAAKQAKTAPGDAEKKSKGQAAKAQKPNGEKKLPADHGQKSEKLGAFEKKEPPAKAPAESKTEKIGAFEKKREADAAETSKPVKSGAFEKRESSATKEEKPGKSGAFEKKQDTKTAENPKPAKPGAFAKNAKSQESDEEAVTTFRPKFVREEENQPAFPRLKMPEKLKNLFGKVKLPAQVTVFFSKIKLPPKLAELLEKCRSISPVKVLSVMTAVLAVMFVVLSIQAFRLTAAMKLAEQGQNISMEATLPPVEMEEIETTAPVATYVVQTTTVGILGDFFMNKYITDAVYLKEHDSFDFSGIFRYLKPTLDDYDYCVASLETTLGGKEFPYQGSPNANSPDDLIDDLYDVGVQMLVTANEHCFDTGSDGFARTLDVLEEKNVRSLGTVRAAGDAPYQVVDLDGVRVGFLAYTYEDSDGTTVPTWDKRKMPEGGYDLVSSFPKKNPDLRFEEIRQYQQEMRNAGADLTVIYMHWGNLYTTEASGNQQAFAQELCNMGYDIIVGSHPHMVQPVSLLQSEDDELHHTICAYSLGNALSNQRLGTLGNVKTAHTEDGAMLTVTLEKYSDGTVYLAAVNMIPLWVRLVASATREYSILPLDGKRENDWKVSLDLTESSLASCQKSYKRTMDIIGEGLSDCRSFLEEQKENRDTAYFNQSIGESGESIP